MLHILYRQNTTIWKTTMERIITGTKLQYRQVINLTVVQPPRFSLSCMVLMVYLYLVNCTVPLFKRSRGEKRMCFYSHFHTDSESWRKYKFGTTMMEVHLVGSLFKLRYSIVLSILVQNILSSRSWLIKRISSSLEWFYDFHQWDIGLFQINSEFARSYPKWKRITKNT